MFPIKNTYDIIYLCLTQGFKEETMSIYDSMIERQEEVARQEEINNLESRVETLEAYVQGLIEMQPNPSFSVKKITHDIKR
jgi:hypothetical protein